MKRIHLILHIIIFIAITSSSIYGQQLDENLNLLKPFTNKIWESKMQGLHGEGMLLGQREWKVQWEGKVIRYTSRIEMLNAYTEGYFFWDPDKNEISMFTLNNRGRFVQGHVKQENGKILMYGHVTFEDKKLKFNNYFEFTEDGKILDKWYRFEGGEWKPGHSVELYEKKE